MVQGPALLISFICSMIIMLMLHIRCKVHSFLALLFAAFAIGFAAGMDPSQIAYTAIKGFGTTMERVGMVILAGGIMAVILERSGAILVIAETILRIFGGKRPVLAMSIIGYIVSIPVMCDAGYMLLASINKVFVQKTGVPAAAMAVALSTGLFATYTLVPPTPGPVAVAGTLHADMGIVFWVGLITAMPATWAGYLWVVHCTGNSTVSIEAAVEPVVEPVVEPMVEPMVEPTVENKDDLADVNYRLGVVRPFVSIMTPIVLITLKALANLPGKPLGSGSYKAFVDFTGEPAVALLLGVLVALCLLSKLDEETLNDWVGAGIRETAEIIAVAAAGGMLGTMLTVTNIGQSLSQGLLHYNIGICLPFLIAAVLKTMQGSTTVALVTAAAVVWPQLAVLGLSSPAGAALTTLAIGAGAMTVSHVNDPYFWIVARFPGLSTELALKTHTMATLIMGLTAMLVVWIMQLVIR